MFVADDLVELVNEKMHAHVGACFIFSWRQPKKNVQLTDKVLREFLLSGMHDAGSTEFQLDNAVVSPVPS
jgi:hypothetical protein